MQIFEPAYTYIEGIEHGLFSVFEPGTRILPAGFQVDPKFRPLPVEIVFEKDANNSYSVVRSSLFHPDGSTHVSQSISDQLEQRTMHYPSMKSKPFVVIEDFAKRKNYIISQ